MRISILILTILMLPISLYGQQQYWTLEDCVMYALNNNIDIKSKVLDVRQKETYVSEHKWNFAPSLYLSNSASISNGRVLDPTTYDFVENEIVVGNSTSLNASVNLFSGLANHHNLKKSKLNLQSAQLSVAQTKEDVYLNVTACYLEILYAEDNIHIAEQIIKELYIQIDKISLKVETGKSTEADLLQIQTKLAEAENELLIAKQNFDIARLNLCYMLEIEDYTSLYLSKPSEPEFLQMDIALSNALLDELVINRPEMKMAEINVEISKCNLSIARSAYYPTISLNIGYGSSFSDARLKTLHNIDGTYRQESYPFIEQYVGNANSYASISINFPIFSKLSIRNNVNRHKILVQQSEYALLQTNKQVRREITQALIEARAACTQYNSAIKAVESANEVARQAALKYELGVISVTDYNTIITSQYQSLIKLAQSKYEYIFKYKILDYFINFNQYS